MWYSYSRDRIIRWTPLNHIQVIRTINRLLAEIRVGSLSRGLKVVKLCPRKALPIHLFRHSVGCIIEPQYAMLQMDGQRYSVDCCSYCRAMRSAKVQFIVRSFYGPSG